MITEAQIRNIATRATHASKSSNFDERQHIIENAIREAILQDRAPTPEPNAGCL